MHKFFTGGDFGELMPTLQFLSITFILCSFSGGIFKKFNLVKISYENRDPEILGLNHI